MKATKESAELPKKLEIRARTLASITDYTLVGPFITREDIHRLIQEAQLKRAAAVTVDETNLSEVNCYLYAQGYFRAQSLDCSEHLEQKIKISLAIDFPFGTSHTSTKAEAVKRAILLGGIKEFDLMTNLGLLRKKNIDAYEDDLRRVLEATILPKRKPLEYIIKFALDNYRLTAEEVALAAGVIARVAKDYLPLRIFVSVSPSQRESIFSIRNVIDRVTNGNYIVGIKAAGGMESMGDIIKMMHAAGCFKQGKSDSLLRENYKELFRIGINYVSEENNYSGLI